MVSHSKIRNRLSKNNRMGFTLIELLVVISIIALLLSVLIPALGKAKKKAQSVVCRNNLRQIGMGFQMYAQNNKDVVVPHYTLEQLPTGIVSTAWFKRLIRDPKTHPFNTIDYINDYTVLFCPTHRLLPPQRMNNPNKKTDLMEYALDRGQISFGMTMTLTHDWSAPGQPFSPAKLSKIAQPSATILAVDAMVKDMATGEIRGIFYVRPFYNGLEVASIRHDGVCNVLWAAGHVTPVKAPDPKKEETIYDREALTNSGIEPNYWDRK